MLFIHIDFDTYSLFEYYLLNILKSIMRCLNNVKLFNQIIKVIIH